MNVMVQGATLILLFITFYANAARYVNDTEWVDFKVKYGKKYDNWDSENRARENFEKNLKLIEEHNANASHAHIFTLKMNQFGDLSLEDYKKEKTEKIIPLVPENRVRLPQNNYNKPESFDLRKDAKGYVTKVEDEGEGTTGNTSWAFSTIGALEGQVFKNRGKKQNLSTEYLLRCALTEAGNKDIDTNSKISHALEYVQKHSIFTEESYSLIKNLDLKCPITDKLAALLCFSKITSTATNNIDEIERELYHFKNLIPAHVDASFPSFQFYHHGIYTEQSCPTNSYNHPVLIVGYGIENGKKYWLVKNSWGTSWGDEGYMKIAHGICGIDSYAMQLEVKMSCCDQCQPKPRAI